MTEQDPRISYSAESFTKEDYRQAQAAPKAKKRASQLGRRVVALLREQKVDTNYITHGRLRKRLECWSVKPVKWFRACQEVTPDTGCKLSYDGRAFLRIAPVFDDPRGEYEEYENGPNRYSKMFTRKWRRANQPDAIRIETSKGEFAEEKSTYEGGNAK